MKFKFKKKCPRCSTKMEADLAICPSCQLNFNKFYEATNEEAKEAMRNGNKDQILMRKGYPTDVKKVTFILLTLFLGFMGAHHYRVGRYKMGIFFTASFIVGVVNAVITSMVKTTLTGFFWEIFTLLVFVWGAVLFMWLTDVYKVCFNKYKIPVSRQK